MSTSKTAAKYHEDRNRDITDALRSDARIEQWIAVAQSAPTPSERWLAITNVWALPLETKAGELLSDDECLRVIWGYVDGETGTIDLRLAGIEGLEGRPLWTIIADADVDAMRTYVEPGQVWVRADLVSGRRSRQPRSASFSRWQRCCASSARDERRSKI